LSGGSRPPHQAAASELHDRLRRASARNRIVRPAAYAPAYRYVDALVASEGENTFREIASLPSYRAWDSNPCRAWTCPRPWAGTQRPSRADHALDDIASPYQIGVMEEQAVTYLETYRGCPFSCTFCEWGATKDSRRCFPSTTHARTGSFMRG